MKDLGKNIVTSAQSRCIGIAELRYIMLYGKSYVNRVHEAKYDFYEANL